MKIFNKFILFTGLQLLTFLFFSIVHSQEQSQLDTVRGTMKIQKMQLQIDKNTRILEMIDTKTAYIELQVNEAKLIKLEFKKISKRLNDIQKNIINLLKKMPNEFYIDFKNKPSKMDVKLQTGFDVKTVYPHYVVGIGTILVALATIFIVYRQANLSITTMEKAMKTQIKTSNDQIDAQNTRFTDQIKEQSKNIENQRVEKLNSGNRQDWINTLRDCVSEYLSLLRILREYTTRIDDHTEQIISCKKEMARIKTSDEQNQENFYNNLYNIELRELEKAKETLYGERNLELKNLYFYASKIELLIGHDNPSADESTLVNSIRDSKSKDGDFMKIEGYIQPITEATQKILKAEWIMIKDGQKSDL